MSPEIWNEDGSPKRPEVSTSHFAAAPFADLASDDQEAAYLSYARMQQQMRANRIPMIGDIVHYWSDGTCSAALVTTTADFDGDDDGLAIFFAGRAGVPMNGAHDEDKAEYTWHWPESQ